MESNESPDQGELTTEQMKGACREVGEVRRDTRTSIGKVLLFTVPLSACIAVNEKALMSDVALVVAGFCCTARVAISWLDRLLVQGAWKIIDAYYKQNPDERTADILREHNIPIPSAA